MSKLKLLVLLEKRCRKPELSSKKIGKGSGRGQLSTGSALLRTGSVRMSIVSARSSTGSAWLIMGYTYKDKYKSKDMDLATEN